jgi:hypothetical protein
MNYLEKSALFSFALNFGIHVVINVSIGLDDYCGIVWYFVLMSIQVAASLGKNRSLDYWSLVAKTSK